MKILTKLCFFLALTFLGVEAQAQATMPRKGAPKQTMRDGVARKFGKMVEFKNGKEMPLRGAYSAGGTKVSNSGMVHYADGTKEKLPEGYAINKQGEKVILMDDMIAPEKIRKHQKEVTGKDETSVTITEKTRLIINDSTGRKAVYDTIRTVETK
ncbi:hypothetical protein I5M27_15790 [Adhaeribacter sp. BT258]|uniref:DUF6799 domain-containing protein n=1 Tax=Adhaeribacter terrigena TaxID=2793070 RepID=A0ABS1C505_9BACT|nr:DUF6799 domain-containing protein [Adhaeribacter terrigena]MBK0404461.1 hypothetical protein [Adhaeribacter terrigena]